MGEAIAIGLVTLAGGTIGGIAITAFVHASRRVREHPIFIAMAAASLMMAVVFLGLAFILLWTRPGTVVIGLGVAVIVIAVLVNADGRRR